MDFMQAFSDLIILTASRTLLGELALLGRRGWAARGAPCYGMFPPSPIAA